MDVKSADVNDYLKDAAGGDFSAKDFRTWNATVLAAMALAVSGRPPCHKTARKRAIKRAIDETARYLGNTPAVCRASYIDPRVFDRFSGGLTIAGVLPELIDPDAEWPEIQPAVEEGVLELIAGNENATAWRLPGGGLRRSRPASLSWLSARRSNRETCICETPIFSAISDWVRSSMKRSLRISCSRSGSPLKAGAMASPSSTSS